MKLHGIANKLTMACIVVACAAWVTACAPVPPSSAPAPTNVPSNAPVEPSRPTPPPPVPTAPSPPKQAGTWSFTLAPGTYTYNFTTSGTVALSTDTTKAQSVPAWNQTATIAIADTGGVDVINPVPVAAGTCDPNSSLITLAQQLIPRIPNQLVAGASWRDSTTTAGCRGMIPLESTVISNYTVVGDTTMNDATLLRISRIDSVTANGEGADGQHRVLISAMGTGVGNLYLSVATGRLTALKEMQNTHVNVTTSGRLSQFVQHAIETVTIAR